MKKVISLISVVTFIIFSSMGSIKAKTKIRIAYPIQEGLTQVDEHGNYSGYTYDYLRQLEHFTDYEFEYVLLTGDENEQIVSAMEKVKKGEIDFMGAMMYDKSLTSMFDYTSNYYGIGNMAIYVSSDNTEINDTTVYSLKNLDVGIISPKKIDNESLKEFGDVNGIQIKQFYYANETELKKSLEDEKIDAISMSEQVLLSGDYNKVATFSPHPFYFVTTKGNMQLVSALNQAMSKLNKEQSSLMSELHEKYFSLKNAEFILTDKEKQFIKDNPVVKVIILGGKAPFQSYDDNEKAEGITIDILDNIGKVSGIQFDYDYTESYDEYIKLLDSGEYMIAGGITSPYRENKNDYTLSCSFLNSNIEMIISKKNAATEVIGKRLALPKGTSYTGKVKGKVIYYDTTVECLEAVNNGDVDYTYLNSHSTQFYNSSLKFENINIIPQENNYAQRNCMAVRNDVSSPLLNIINKGIDNTSSITIQSIIFKNAAHAGEKRSLIGDIKDNPLQFVSFLIIIIGLYLFSRYYMNKKSNEKIHQEYERFQLISDLSGDCFLEYNIEMDCLNLSGGGAKLLSSSQKIENFLKSDKHIGGEVIKNMLSSKRSYNAECDIDFLDGTKRWQHVILQLIENDEAQITHIIGKITDIQMQKEEQMLWRDLAQKDSLTKIFNSAACREHINEFLAGKEKNALAFIILDIDYFKLVNDTYGHFYGDLVLQNLAKTITMVTNSNDIYGRVGGDEFIIGLKYPKDLKSVDEYCNHLMQAILKDVGDSDKKQVTISVGIAFSRAGETYDQLYQIADQALYKVKAEGRNNYCFENTLERDDS